MNVIRSRITELEKITEFDNEITESSFNILHQYTRDFYDSLQDKRSFENSGYEPAEIDEFLEPGNQEGLIEIIDYIKTRINQHGIQPATGAYMGYIPGGGLFESAVGDFIADISNEYTGITFASPGAVRLENSLINWTAKLIGYSYNCSGNLTSGGSMANLIALSTAKRFKNVNSKNVRSSVVYMNTQSHHSLKKALKLTGLYECKVRYIPLDNDWRMQPFELRKTIEDDLSKGLSPFLIISNAGSTDVGAVDPMEEISDISRKYETWHHADGAYGGFFMLTSKGKEQLKGIEKTDSITLDPHKGLFLSYGTGIVLVKEGEKLKDTFTESAGYMQDAIDLKNNWSPADLSPELTRPFRGMRMWIPLKIHGVEKFVNALEQKLLLAQYFYEKVNNLGFETGKNPSLSIVPFRWAGSNEVNHKILDYIHNHCRVFISSTTIDNTYWLRAAILSVRTTLSDVDELLEGLSSALKSSEIRV